VNTGGVNTGGGGVNTGGGGGTKINTGGADTVVIWLLGSLAGEVPKAFVALTVNVYATPGVSPLTTIGDEVEVPVMLPGLEVAI
jgi:hypothetical protein